MLSPFASNFAFQSALLDQVRAILRDNAALFLRFVEADSEQDMKQATDLVLTVAGGARIAVRIRRADTRYRDFTIRCRSRYGLHTELDKLREGWGDWYIYAWQNSDGALSEWVLVDLSVVRGSGLLDEQWRVISNTDGTGFIAIPVSRLSAVGAVKAWKFNRSVKP